MVFSIVSLVMLGVVWGASSSHRGRSLLAEHYKTIFALFVGVLFAYGAYLSSLQYYAMRSDGLAKFLLPPYQDINYFLIHIAGARIVGPYILSLMVAFLFMWASGRHNRKHNEQFFEKEEIYLGALSFFLVGHPGWIIYFPTLIVLYMSIQLYSRFVRRRIDERIPLYHLWVPTAIFVILINEYWLSQMAFWLLLKI